MKNKKVNEKYKGIKDYYLLQCICTEQLDEINMLLNAVSMYDDLLYSIIDDIDRLHNVIDRVELVDRYNNLLDFEVRKHVKKN